MSKSAIVTRFAPSPTGFLHIGGARTALFNWLFSRRNQGTFHLRIEDTDRLRSTIEAVAAIFDGLSWLGLKHDGNALFQSRRQDRHREIAEQLLTNGNAYRCFATEAEVAGARDAAKKANQPLLFDSPWRDADPAKTPDRPFVVRLRSPRTRPVEVTDAVRGAVRWPAETLDDLVLLRSDGSPTYMLAVVVDDHDMGVTHVIRGDDHLGNSGRQALIYQACGWTTPTFAHLPLIHGPDGKKLSKRHGALGIDSYRAMGYTPEAMRNYLARLGWSHGDDELFTTDQAVSWFDLKGIGKSPSRFDTRKLDHVSAHHIRSGDDAGLLDSLADWLAANDKEPLSETAKARLRHGMPVLKQQAKRLPDLLARGEFLLSTPPTPDLTELAGQLNTDAESLIALARALIDRFAEAAWTRENHDALVCDIAVRANLKPARLFRLLRSMLAGIESKSAPSVHDMLSLLGRRESLKRMAAAVPESV